MPRPQSQLSADQLSDLLAKLAEPFEPEEIQWVVKERTHDGSRGKIFPYADPRAYTDRLDKTVTPLGWRDRYAMATLPGITRQKLDQIIQTGKVLLICTLTIRGLGTKRGTGEEWGDDNNAMTGADAQALKRACVGFGLGRYLYDFKDIWVPLDGNGNPAFLPELPQWALPQKYRTGTKLTSIRAGRSTRGPITGLIDTKATSKIESFRWLLGEAIYMEILKKAGQCRTAATVSNAHRQKEVLLCMEKAARGIRRVNSLSKRLSAAQFIDEMNSLNLTSANAIPSLELLIKLAGNLEAITQGRAA